MVDSRQKGARGENAAKDILIKHTKLLWRRTPGSGALHEAHKLKGDIYIPECNNIYCVEVKNYKDDHISTKLLTDKEPQLYKWWAQAIRQAAQVDKLPLLIFKHDRSKLFVALEGFLDLGKGKRSLFIEELGISICLLEDWLVYEKPNFIKG